MSWRSDGLGRRRFIMRSLDCGFKIRRPGQPTEFSQVGSQPCHLARIRAWNVPMVQFGPEGKTQRLPVSLVDRVRMTSVDVLMDMRPHRRRGPVAVFLEIEPGRSEDLLQGPRSQNGAVIDG